MGLGGAGDPPNLGSHAIRLTWEATCSMRRSSGARRGECGHRPCHVNARGGSGREAVGCRGGGHASVRAQAPTSAGGWSLVRICVVLKSSVGHVQQLMAVQNVDLVKPMLDQAFTSALLAMANAARFEYTHHGIRALQALH